MFIVSLLITAKIWKEPKCPSIDGLKKKYIYIYTHTHNGILLSHKKE